MRKVGPSVRVDRFEHCAVIMSKLYDCILVGWTWIVNGLMLPIQTSMGIGVFVIGSGE